MVGLVVDDDDVPLVAQAAADAADHLAFGFGEGRVAAALAAQDVLGELAGLDLLAAQEGVEVGDDDLGLAQLVHQVGGHDVHCAVVVARVAGQQHPQPVADRDAGRDDQEGVGEAGVLGVGQLVERLPGDQHGHDHGLAAAGGHLAGDAEQAGVGVLVDRAEVVLDPGVAVLLGDLGDVDQRFQGLDLAEEQPAGRGRVGASIQQPGGGAASRRGVAALAPELHRAADVVDRLVFLDAVCGPLVRRRAASSFPFFRGWAMGMKYGLSAGLDDLVGDALVVEAEMALRLRRTAS